MSYQKKNKLQQRQQHRKHPIAQPSFKVARSLEVLAYI